ncbi:MAG TPA: HAMP domain-containing protein, partial [Candidatus Ozemobacteraceae bacterium]|nr:HAMP domain-containing protein [Candidatus Ozemobacteraceae bacterium]
MFSIPPQRLQSSLIFYITCIIVFTNGFFAIITLSRENIAFYNEGINRALFLGKVLSRPASQALRTGTFAEFDECLAPGRLQGERNPVTLFDRNWWPVRGDPARLPPEGYPPSLATTEIANRSGVTGTSSRELFFPLYDGDTFLGAIEIGLPEFHSPKVVDAAWQVLFVAGINILLGVALAIFIAQVIVRPLNQLLDGLEAVGRGDYSQRVQVFGEGELAQVGRMFNTMSASLQEKVSESLDRTRMLDEKVQELWEIYELTKAMGFNLNLHEILERFLEKALALSSSSYGQIMLHVAETGRLEWSVGTPVFPRLNRQTYEEALDQCVRERAPFEKKTDNYTLLFFPLLSGNAIHGVLFLGKVGCQSYSEGVQRFLDTISPLGGSLIENARLYQHVVEMKDYVRHVLESVDAGVATIDHEGRLITINSAFVRHLGLSDLRPQHQELEVALQDLPDRDFCDKLCRLVRGRDSGGQVQRSMSGRFYVSQRREMPLHVS